MLALLPDIHANRQALQAVLADAHSRGANQWAALGDIIGFGGAPAECTQLIRQLRAVTLRGNHEEALATPSLFAHFPAVQRMAQRTRDLLPRDLIAWLTTLPCTAETNGLPLTHATFHAPERWGRLQELTEAERSFSAQSAPLAFFGHTHRPAVFCRDTEGNICRLPVSYDESGSFCLRTEAGKRYLINPGSVGQPRDGDPRAAYALWDGASVTLRRVSYDAAAAAEETLRMGLPEAFAEALRQGKSPL